MNDLSGVEAYLRGVSRREIIDEIIEGQIKSTLKSMKRQAVGRGDQETAKLIWCYAQILTVQNNYLSAFHKIKEVRYYDAWCLLERVEIELASLTRHFQSAPMTDEYKIRFIEKHAKNFQSLFPYSLFLSPAFLHLEKVCSTCGKPISIRNPCGHKVGEIYDGEMCHRIITKSDVLETSLVTTPVQKYSVPFMVDPETGQQRDHYDYTLVKYVRDGLRDPFDSWDLLWTKKRHPHSHFKHVGRNEACPCESGKKYKECCLRQPGVLRPHAQILFSVPPPDSLLKIQYTRT